MTGGRSVWPRHTDVGLRTSRVATTRYTVNGTEVTGRGGRTQVSFELGQVRHCKISSVGSETEGVVEITDFPPIGVIPVFPGESPS